MLPAVLIPRLQDSSEVGFDEAANPAQLSGTETLAASESERLEPELAGLLLPLHMKMWRLATVEAREEEPVWPRVFL